MLPTGVLPVPLFLLEGIFTRNVLAGKSKDEQYEIKYLETSFLQNNGINFKLSDY